MHGSTHGVACAVVMWLLATDAAAQQSETRPGEHGAVIRPEAQVRTRGQLRVAPKTFEAGQPRRGEDTQDVRSRVRVGLELQARHVTLALRVQQVSQMGERPPGRLRPTLTALHEGYVQLGDGGTWVRLGRQVLAFGDERLIGGADWAMMARSFDALRVRGDFSPLTLDVFGAIVSMDSTVTDAAGERARCDGDYLVGVQLAGAIGEHTLEAYVFYRSDGPTASDLSNDRSIGAPGVRATGELGGGVGYTVEGVFQAGTRRDARLGRRRQQALGLAGGLRFEPARTTRLDFGGSFATGDSEGTRWTELDNFYPTNRRHYGHANVVGWRNLREGHGKVMLRPGFAPLRAHLAYHVLAQANGEARWSDAGGSTLGKSAEPGGTLLGSEVDVELRWEPFESLFLELGYAVFAPASGAARLGHPDPMHQLYLFVGGQLP